MVRFVVIFLQRPAISPCSSDLTVLFRPEVLHAAQAWQGFRISITADTTRMLPKLATTDKKLRKLQFPLPSMQPQGPTTSTTSTITPSQNVCVSNMEQSREPTSTTSTITPSLALAYTTTSGDQGGDLHAVDEQTPSDQQSEVPEYQRKQWEAQLAKFHKAAGNPSNRNLSRVVKEAGHPQWNYAQAALGYRCPTCESQRLAAPARPTPPFCKAWEAVSIDVGECVVPGSKNKVKFALFVDMPTKLRAVFPMKMYEVMEMKTESTDEIIMGFAERWLGVFPKPRYLIMDAANTFSSDKMHDFLSSINIIPHFVAERGQHPRRETHCFFSNTEGGA